MKVSVCARVTYNYEVEIPEMVTDLPCYADSADPVYFNICKMLAAKGLNYEGDIVSIVDEDTDEVLYVGE
jgi:hypothetical protein